MTSSWPRSAGCTGSTPSGFTAPSTTSRPSSSRPPIITNRTPTSRLESNELSLHQTQGVSTTDTDPAWVAAHYAGRWSIEVVFRDNCGRDRPCGRPPAQIPACAANALGSCLGYERQIACWAKDAGDGRVVAIESRGGSCASSSGGCAG